MAYIIKFKIGNGKWLTNTNAVTKASANRTAKYMKNQHDPDGNLVKTKTKLVKVDMRKSKSSLNWIPKKKK